MLEPLFSVIVPVYNTESRLEQCVRSILGQSESNYELILINDGSADKSGEMCDYFAGQDERIKVIHQSNGGVSKARNAGLDIARGKYIVFVDSDDYLGKGALLSFQLDDAEMVVGCVQMLSSNGSIERLFENADSHYYIQGEEDIAKFYGEWYSHQIWGKCFSRDIIEEYGLRFDPDLNFGEDVLFDMQYVAHIQTVNTINKVVYNWCRTDVSFLSDPGSAWAEKLSILHEKLYSYFEKMPKVQEQIMMKYCWAVEDRIYRICSSNKCSKGVLHQIREMISTSFLRRCIQNGIYKNENKALQFAISNQLALLTYFIFRK